MSWRESPLLIACEGETLIGVLAEPAQADTARNTGVVIVVGGPQYRAGSHRQFTDLARALAGAGYAALRFDLRGMGDSTGNAPGFDACDTDVAAAVDALLQRCPHLEGVALWGLCDGASAALLYLDVRADTRITGLCLLNPWVRSPAGLASARVKHYYLQRLGERDFWAKLLRGGVGFAALRGWMANVRLARSTRTGGGVRPPTSYQDRMARAWSAFPGRILLILSGQDLTAREFVDYALRDTAWQGLLSAARVECCDLPEADHTFSAPDDKCRVEARTIDWLATLGATVR